MRLRYDVVNGKASKGIYRLKDESKRRGSEHRTPERGGEQKRKLDDTIGQRMRTMRTFFVVERLLIPNGDLGEKMNIEEERKRRMKALK